MNAVDELLYERELCEITLDEFLCLGPIDLERVGESVGRCAVDDGELDGFYLAPLVGIFGFHVVGRAWQIEHLDRSPAVKINVIQDRSPHVFVVAAMREDARFLLVDIPGNDLVPLRGYEPWR